MREFGENTGQSIVDDGITEMLGDLLSDIAHLCDRTGDSLPDLLERARMHYRDETNNKGKQFRSLTFGRKAA